MNPCPTKFAVHEEVEHNLPLSVQKCSSAPLTSGSISVKKTVDLMLYG